MRALVALCTLCLLGGCAARPFVTFEDPRPEGRLSLRERSLCEPPEAQPDWCEFPHEVRAFLERREGCDHFRDEPVPDAADDPGGRRRREIEAALREYCVDTDAELARLRTHYRGDASVGAALGSFGSSIE